MAEHFFIGNPEDMPEGLRDMIEAWQSQNDRQEMAASSNEHTTNQFLLELDVEQLGILGRMFRSIARSNDPNAVYYCAQIDTILQVKHNICPLHMVNHDQELADNLAAETSEGGEASTT